MKDAFIISALRSPVTRAGKGSLRATRPDDLAAAVLQGVLQRARHGEEQRLPASEIEDVILGCATPEAEQGHNIARIAALRAGFPVTSSAMTVNRFCASGLEAIALASERIHAGVDLIVAGGVESMSMVPVGGHKPSPNPALIESRPDTYLSMGLAAERLALRYAIPRAQADTFALRSHQKACNAQDFGKFHDEILPIQAQLPGDPQLHRSGGQWEERLIEKDEGPRRDTSLEALAALKPAFHARGQVTAGNASQRSDGAAALLLASKELCKRHQLEPIARLVAYATAGVEPAMMGTGPVPAIARVLERASLRLEQMEIIELNEAFAVQALAVIQLAGLDSARVNVNGGAIALGHPLGCTGARLAVSALAELRRRSARYALIALCVGGGMGAAAIFENLAR